MRIAELAGRARVKVSTVRFYERRGFLAQPPRTTGGDRDYDDTALTQLRFLRRGQELGFTLNELTDFTALSAGLRSGVVDVGSVTAAAVDKLQEIDGRIQDLQRTRDALETLLHQQRIDPNEECPIVQALSVESSTR
ncbi:DNA-binding transcriptional MerR regulator [Arthrobacter sp. B3I9]|uniref:MerR family transcriptional regulator n=1 Tax=Arthrobacter sp. B3I9 TaxID=3042270 RepID=UPI00279134C5|nr:MerR family transcriptional regulator [Arthrobacter sp. B3I9]MDQ0851295.1 DNA-binding transcriptional MerR regulator [Arthrobacter sp. B3I9]